MHKSVKSKPAGIAQTRRVLSALAQRVQTVTVAANTGIHQSQVSRLLRGQFKRISPNVRTLLAYATDPKRYASANEPGEAAKALVIKAALRTWDATPEGAQALVRLLRSVEGIRRLRNSK